MEQIGVALRSRQSRPESRQDTVVPLERWRKLRAIQQVALLNADAWLEACKPLRCADHGGYRVSAAEGLPHQLASDASRCSQNCQLHRVFLFQNYLRHRIERFY